MKQNRKASIIGAIITAIILIILVIITNLNVKNFSKIENIVKEEKISLMFGLIQHQIKMECAIVLYLMLRY